MIKIVKKNTLLIICLLISISMISLFSQVPIKEVEAWEADYLTPSSTYKETSWETGTLDGFTAHGSGTVQVVGNGAYDGTYYLKVTANNLQDAYAEWTAPGTSITSWVLTFYNVKADALADWREILEVTYWDGSTEKRLFRVFNYGTAIGITYFKGGSETGGEIHDSKGYTIWNDQDWHRFVFVYDCERGKLLYYIDNRKGAEIDDIVSSSDANNPYQYLKRVRLGNTESGWSTDGKISYFDKFSLTSIDVENTFQPSDNKLIQWWYSYGQNSSCMLAPGHVGLGTGIPGYYDFGENFTEKLDWAIGNGSTSIFIEAERDTNDFDAEVINNWKAKHPDIPITMWLSVNDTHDAHPLADLTGVDYFIWEVNDRVSRTKEGYIETIYDDVISMRVFGVSNKTVIAWYIDEDAPTTVTAEDIIDMLDAVIEYFPETPGIAWFKWEDVPLDKITTAVNQTQTKIRGDTHPILPTLVNILRIKPDGTFGSDDRVTATMERLQGGSLECTLTASPLVLPRNISLTFYSETEIVTENMSVTGGELLGWQWLNDYLLQVNISMTEEEAVFIAAVPLTIDDVVITNMEGCGDWVFAEEKYYNFRLTAHGTFTDLELLMINFTAGSEVIAFSYNFTDETWNIDSGEDCIRLKTGTVTYYDDNSFINITFPVLFTKHVEDDTNIDINAGYKYINQSARWCYTKNNYFNIYNLGGAASDTFIGYAGRRIGGDVFELYAGPGGQEIFYEETFDGYTEGENPPGWIIYEPNATTKTEVTLTSLLWAGHSYPLGLRLRDKTNENYYAYAKYKFGTVTDNFKVQFFLTTAQGGDSAVRLDYNNQPGPVIVADGQGYPYGSILKFRNSSGLFPLDNSVTLSDGTFYNITLDINMATKTYDIYVDGVLKHSGAEFNDTSISALNMITLTTYAISLTEYSDFTVDDIKMWYGTSQTGMGIAQTTVAFRNLQHMHTLFAVGIPNGDAYIADPNEGFVEFGIDYCIDDEWINNAWKVRINVTDARLVGYTFWSHVTGNPPADWIRLDISWYTHNTTYVKTDTIYTYWEGQGGSADWFRLWLDLWFNKINASSTVGGRVGTYYYGVEDQSNPWLRLVNGAEWGIKAQEHTHSLFFAPLTDAEGNIVSASRIKMVRIRCKVWRSNNKGYRWELRNFDVLNYRFAPNIMQGVDTPTFQAPRMPTLPSGGLLASLQAALQSSLNALIEHLVTAGLYMFPIFVGFMDNIFAYFGYPGLFSTILNAASNFFTYFALTLNYTVQFLPPLFDVLSNTFSFIISYLINFINVYIQIATIVKGILDGTYTITTGLGNIWELMNVEGWDEAIPLFLFIAWMVSIDSRARRAKKYGVGWTEIFVRDVKVIMDVVSFILHLFTTIADWSIGLILKIISAIPL